MSTRPNNRTTMAAAPMKTEVSSAPSEQQALGAARQRSRRDLCLENARDFATVAQRMLGRHAATGEVGILYSAAEQLAQAAREVNRLIGHYEATQR